MTLGIVFSSIVAGLLGVLWGIAAGFSVGLAILFYPLAGVAGALVFLTFALLQPDRATDYAGSHRTHPLS